jgi:hypothetical protein
MIKRFHFEELDNEQAACVPMGVKRLLDHSGLKISRAQWGALSEADRTTIYGLPAPSVKEIVTTRALIRDAITRASGMEPAALSPEQQRLADPPSQPSQELIERAAALGFHLDGAQWKRLDADQRYALTKLGIASKSDRKLGNALGEFGITRS